MLDRPSGSKDRAILVYSCRGSVFIGVLVSNLSVRDGAVKGELTCYSRVVSYREGSNCLTSNVVVAYDPRGEGSVCHAVLNSVSTKVYKRKKRSRASMVDVPVVRGVRVEAIVCGGLVGKVTTVERV